MAKTAGREALIQVKLEVLRFRKRLEDVQTQRVLLDDGREKMGGGNGTWKARHRPGWLSWMLVISASGAPGQKS